MLAYIRITRAQTDCVCSCRKDKLSSCWLTERSGSCVPAPRRPHSFPLYTSSPQRRSKRRASKGGHRHKHRHSVGSWAARRQRLALDAFWRRLPVNRWFATPAHCGDCLTSARVGGDWSTHLSRYLIAMLWGLDLVTRKPSDNVLHSRIIYIFHWMD